MYKSPEMLLMHAGGRPMGVAAAVAGAGQLPPGLEPAKLVAARAVAGGAVEMRSTRAGLASDVWSFGCLAYEVRGVVAEARGLVVTCGPAGVGGVLWLPGAGCAVLCGCLA